MRTQINVLLLAVLFIPLFNSCIPDVFISGNHEIVEEERIIPTFKRISSSGSFNIYYEYASEPSLLLVGESNILEYIETYVSGNELKITTPFNVSLNPREVIEVFVKGPYPDEIKLSGSGLIYTDTIFNDYLSLKISGSGDIDSKFVGETFESTISGSGRMFLYADCKRMETLLSGSGRIEAEGYADDARYTITGSGKIMALDLEAEEARVLISGSGDLYLNVFDELTGTISGSGNIYYIGRPSVNVTITGSGRVKKY
jgi:hypothetical protein